MRNLGYEVECPNNHEKCTADLSKYASIGQEGHYASEVASIFRNENIKITHFCSEADSKIKNVFKEIFPDRTDFLDKNHLSRG